MHLRLPRLLCVRQENCDALPREDGYNANKDAIPFCFLFYGPQQIISEYPPRILF